MATEEQSTDEPFVTEEGHLLLDAPLGPVEDVHALAAALTAIPGVVEHGLFLGLADEALIGTDKGVVSLTS